MAMSLWIVHQLNPAQEAERNDKFHNESDPQQQETDGSEKAELEGEDNPEAVKRMCIQTLMKNRHPTMD